MLALSPGQGCSIQEDTSHKFGPTPRRHPEEAYVEDVRERVSNNPDIYWVK